MKKTFILLTAIAAAVCAGFTSCDDDNDLPDVSMSITIEGGVFDTDGDIYVVQGDELNVQSVNIVNNIQGQSAAITYANYYWNYQLVAASTLPPFGCAGLTDADTPVGKYDLEITTNVLAVDKELANAVLDYDVIVVADASQIPASATGTTYIGD